MGFQERVVNSNVGTHVLPNVARTRILSGKVGT